LRQQAYRIDRIDAILNRLVNYTSITSFQPGIIHEMLTGAGDGLGTVLKTGGTTLEHLIETSERSFSSNIDTLLKGPLQYILKILILLLVIAAIGFLVYLKCASPNFKFSIPTAPSDETPPTSLTEAFFRLARNSFQRANTSNHKKPDPVEMVPFPLRRDVLSATLNSGLRSPHIEVLVNLKHKALALVDTGAALSLIDRDFLSNIDGHVIFETPYRPLAANREPIKLDGQAMITIDVADVTETFLVQVQPKCTADLILGNNF